MSIKHLFFQKLVNPLLDAYERSEAEEIAYRLIDAYLDKTRLQFWDITTSSTDLESDDILEKINQAIERILLNEPVQYVVGHTYFLDYKINVNPDVLIPRQETEELASRIIALERDSKDLRILDIGTGSGCLPISLEQKLHCQKVYGADISKGALEIAKDNALANQSQVDFFELDILNASIPLKELDIIVSNPPYVLESDKSLMGKNVLDHEPHIALFVPNDDPLRFYRAIGIKSMEALKHGGRLYFEIHEGFGTEVKTLLEGLGYVNIETHQDLFLSKDRMIFAKRG